ncbi:unnamed protein product, partial [Prorocentrum cordatum]
MRVTGASQGFTITAGIGQGCPVSPLLFVLVTFNRQLDTVEGRRERWAFANDFALAGAGGHWARPQLRRHFAPSAAASGLRLNFEKIASPDWGAARIAFCGAHLGFEVGPAAAESRWGDSVRKYKELRVALVGGNYQRRLRLDELRGRFEAARSRAAAPSWDIEWRWHAWFTADPVPKLLAAMGSLARQGIAEPSVVEQGAGRGPGLPAGPPGPAVPTGHAASAELTAPRVRAAVLRTWLNGWCTGPRFGARGGRCLFGCTEGDDDVRHYVRCRHLWRFGVDKFGLADPGHPEARATRALLWHAGAPPQEVARTATMVAVGYKAHAVVSHAARANPYIQRVFAEVLRQLQKRQPAAGEAGN